MGSEYITLLGTEEVTRAASRMNVAAADMQRAADSFGGYVQELRIILEQHEIEMREIMEHRDGKN